MSDVPLQSIGRGFAFNEKILDMLLDGFDADGYARRFNDAKSAAWMLEHLAATRRFYASVLEIEVPPPPWKKTDGSVSDGKVSDECPAPQQVIADFAAVGAEIVAKLSGMTNEDFTRTVSHIVTRRDVTLAEQLQFFHFHESYHLGQIGLIRAMLGLPYAV